MEQQLPCTWRTLARCASSRSLPLPWIACIVFARLVLKYAVRFARICIIRPPLAHPVGHDTSGSLFLLRQQRGYEALNWMEWRLTAYGGFSKTCRSKLVLQPCHCVSILTSSSPVALVRSLIIEYSLYKTLSNAKESSSRLHSSQSPGHLLSADTSCQICCDVESEAIGLYLGRTYVGI